MPSKNTAREEAWRRQELREQRERAAFQELVWACSPLHVREAALARKREQAAAELEQVETFLKAKAEAEATPPPPKKRKFRLPTNYWSSRSHPQGR